MKVLVLSGGGARGAYQLGCLEELLKQGLQFDAIVGTSVGSINAAGFSMLGIEQLKNVWMSIQGPSDIISLNWWKLPWARGVYSLKPLKEALKEELGKSTSISHPFYMGVCDLESLDVEFPANDPNNLRGTIQNILASSAMPGIMDPVDVVKVDGGVRDIVPLSFAIEDLQATEVTVISCSPYHRTQYAGPFDAKFPKILSYVLRTIEAMTAEIQWQDIELCRLYNNQPGMRNVKVTVYAPGHKPILDALDFYPDKIKKAYDLGKEMALLPVLSFGG